MRIAHNLPAISTNRQKSIIGAKATKSMAKLSSGMRINSAADDAAGLAISEKMRGQIRGLNMASKNCQDGISLVQTAEGGLQTTQDILQRMRELAVQAASDTNENTIDRAALDAEYQALMNEVDTAARQTEFNEIKLLDGSLGDATAGELKYALGDVTNISFFPGDLPTKTSSDPAHGAYRFTSSLSDAGKVEIIESSNVRSTPGTVVATGYYTYKDPYYSGDIVTINFDNGAVLQFEYASDSNGNSVTYLGGQTINIVDFFVGKNENGNFLYPDPMNPNSTDYDYGNFNLYGGNSLVIQSGANSGDEYKIRINAMNSGAIGVRPSDIASGGEASASIQKVSNAINTVSKQRAELGAAENRLSFKIGSLDISSENLQASESRVRDLDMAKEMTELAKQNILSQSGTSMLAQANTIPQGVLQLLG